MAHITIADVREDMLDRQAEDHLVLTDLAFTDDDILWAMKSAARKYNSLRPLGYDVRWDRLPEHTSLFFDGIAWALLRRWQRNVAMNDLDYEAGGMSASVHGSLNKNLSRLVEKLEQEFVEAATALKTTLNVRAAFGKIG
jgi:hypothetical protein